MTFVSYPNIVATSESKQFRIDIIGTPSEDVFRDQSKFVYRLFKADEIVWEWAASETDHPGESLDDFPHDAWVNNDGWVVVRTHGWFHAGLMVFSPGGQVLLRQSHRKFLDDDLPGFLDGEPEEYLGD